MSKLAAYLAKTGTSQRKFAAKIGRDPSIVSRLCSGDMTPTLDLAFRIENETRGAVKASAWLAKQDGSAG